MARKRQLDPEFFTDEDMGSLPALGRLFYQGLWCLAEDTGVFEVRLRKLKVEILPYDEEANVETYYQQLKEMGKIIEYEQDGKRCGFIKSFHKRQSITHPSASQLPLPPDPYYRFIPESIRLRNKCQRVSEDADSTNIALSEDSYRIELNRNEQNRIEKNLKEQNSEKAVFTEDIINISDEEIPRLINMFDNEEKLKLHLEARNVCEWSKERVISAYNEAKRAQNQHNIDING